MLLKTKLTQLNSRDKKARDSFFIYSSKIKITYISQYILWFIHASSTTNFQKCLDIQQTLDMCAWREGGGTYIDSAIIRDTLPLVSENRTTYCSMVKQRHYERIAQPRKKRYTHIEAKKLYRSRSVQIEKCLYRDFTVHVITYSSVATCDAYSRISPLSIGEM